ncbi:hypothetical protein Tco_0751909 [Tanacetum coccineum]|uniref:Uncharacterized protein n=1 Tax=Tanacetum coccineum TaxID=301880 RepID=A0ABQ4Z8W5_9ASTR
MLKQLLQSMIVNEPLVLDEKLVQSMIVDELVLHMVVVMEEMCRLVIVEELSKVVNDTVEDCTKVDELSKSQVIRVN